MAAIAGRADRTHNAESSGSRLSLGRGSTSITDPAPASAVPNDRDPGCLNFPDQFFGCNLGVWLRCEIIRGDDAGYRRAFNRGGWLSNGCYSRAPMPGSALIGKDRKLG